MRIIVGLLVSALLFEPVTLLASQSSRQALFKIERNKNANIVQYDAQIGTDGKLERNRPIVVYWVRLAEQGQIKKLSWIQKTFAYGFRADHDRESDSVSLDMYIDIGQPIKVQYENGLYRAMVKINGKSSQLVKIFIHAHGKGLSTRVDYIELYGADLSTGDDTYLRFIP